MSCTEIAWTDELEEILFEKLPVPIICLLRCVCKKWSSWPCSRSGNRVDRPTLVFPCVESDRASLATYSPSLNKWYHIPLCNLKPNLPLLHLWKPLGDIYLVAADGGLLCFMIGFATPQKDVKFLIVNPLANTWRQLPPFPDDRPAKPPLVCGLQVEKNTRTYKLTLAGQILTFGEEEARVTHVYDSSTQQWKSGGDLPHEIYGVQKQCVFWNRSFHYVDCCANQVRAYDELDGMWRKVLPTIPSFVCSPTLVESKGDVLLVGAIGKFPKLEILELDPSRREWRKVEAVPVEAAVEAFLHKIVPGPRHASLLCVGQGDLIYVSNAGLNLTILFDFLRRSWSFLPSRPASKVCILDVKAVFTFIPTFTTSV